MVDDDNNGVADVYPTFCKPRFATENGGMKFPPLDVSVHEALPLLPAFHGNSI